MYNGYIMGFSGDGEISRKTTESSQQLPF